MHSGKMESPAAAAVATVEAFTLSERQAAEFLGVSCSTLRRDRVNGHAGGIPFVRIGARVAYLRPTLEGWLAGQQQVVKPAAPQAGRSTCKRGRPTKLECAEAERRGITVHELRARRAGGVA